MNIRVLMAHLPAVGAIARFRANPRRQLALDQRIVLARQCKEHIFHTRGGRKNRAPAQQYFHADPIVLTEVMCGCRWKNA
jgi:hypothetical protein